MKKCNSLMVRWLVFLFKAPRGLFMIFSLLAMSMNLTAQTANLTQEDDVDFNKGYLNNMVAGSNHVSLPYKATSWGSFTGTASLPKALRNHQATYWNKQVFVTGGLEVVAFHLGVEVVEYSSSVYVAEVNNGLSNWHEDKSLPAGVSEHAAVVANGYLYVIGGMSDSLPVNKIYYSKLRADGSLRDWQESITTLPVPLWGHTAEVVNGRLFVVGGSNTADTTAVNGVYSSQINPDGTLSAFTAETNVLPANRNNHSMVAYGDRLYVFGGYDETLLPTSTVYYADVALDGTLGAWQSGGTMPEPLYAHSSTLQNGVITLMGGYNDTSYFSVQYAYMADIAGGPSFNWLQSELYFEHWASSAAFAADGQVYTIGGYDIFNNTLYQNYYNTLTLSGTERVSDGTFLSQVFELGIDRSVSDLVYQVLDSSAQKFYYRTAVDGGSWSQWTDSTGIDTISLNESLRYVQYLFKINGVSGDHPEALDLARLSFTATQLAGTISSDTTWTLSNSPYWVTDDVFLAGNATITVEAGVTITFGEGTKLEVQNAQFNCDGNSEQQVIFTSFTGEDGFWKGLHFASTSNGHNSALNHVVIENAGFQGNANLNVWGSNQPTINTGTLQKGTNRALYVNAGWPTFNDVTFADNMGYVIEVESGGTGNMNNPVFTGNEFETVSVLGSTINYNSYWDNFGLDYNISGNIIIGGYNSYTKTRLTIDKGLTLRFPSGTGITVGNYNGGGELWAEGTADPDSMITFTSLNGEAGGWNGIYFNSNSSSSSYSAASFLKHCIIEKGNNYNIFIESSDQPVIENCTITNSLHKGVKLYNASPTITDCEVFGHPEEGLYGDGQNNAIISGSNFYNNGWDGFFAGGNLTIFNSTFHDNGGAGLHLTGYVPNVENVVIQDNGSHGLWVTDCDPDFVNVDVLNNGGHGFYMNANVWPEYYDLVLSGNATNDFRVDGGAITHNITWQVGQYPFIIIGSFSIGGYYTYSQQRLTLEKGLTLRFAPGTGITVGGYVSSGSLWAEGADHPDSLITFTSLNGEIGGWNGILFDYYSDDYGTSLLKHCIIEKGNNYNIQIYSSTQPTLDHCTISNSLHKGINLSSASPTITNCEIFGNTEEGLYGNGQCDAFISGSHFYDNGTDGLQSSGNMFILNSDFYDNNGAGLHLTGYAPTVENALIQGNGSHGLWVADCDPDFVNVDVLNNAGHGFYMNANVWPEYYDLVLSGNATNDFRIDGGTINRDITWQVGQYPFIIIGSFYIGGYYTSSQQRLTLEKGLTLRFAPNTGITVGGYVSSGSLWAEGANHPDSLITFTSLNGEIGGWNGIYFDYYSDDYGSSLLKHCVIEKGKDYNIYSSNTSQPTVDSTVIRESGKYGMHIYYGNPTIRNSQVVSNSSYGIYLDYNANPVIGDSAGLGNDIFNNGEYDVYNNSSNNIFAAGNFWGTTDDAVIQQHIYDYNDDGSKGTVLYATAASQSTGLLGQYMSLAARYANNEGTILDKVMVTTTGLTEEYEYTSRTNSAGLSTFTNLADQEYSFSYLTDKPWEGVNGTDALKVMQHFSAINTLSGIYLSAADVNASNSVNSTDAMLILQRFAWLIDSFAAGDWVFELDGGDTVTIAGAGFNDTIRGLCYGDVNGSYIPATQLKNGYYPVGISRKGDMTSAGNLVDLPVYASEDMSLGAISLEIYYDESILAVEDVEVNYPGGHLMYNAANGSLLVAWFSLEPMSVNTEDPLMYITVNIADVDAFNTKTAFRPGVLSELADANARVINGIELFYPAVTVSSVTSAGEISKDVQSALTAYPNPFTAATNLQFILPEASGVSLKIYNSLGRMVGLLVDEGMDAGSHTVQWNASEHTPGIYYYILETDNGKDVAHYSGKLILKQ